VPSTAFANATAAEENSMNVPREGSGLNQWMGLHLLLHSGGKSLMQCTAAIELLIFLTALACQPAVSAPARRTLMKRQSIALFLSTLALAGGTVACGKQPEAGEGAEQEPKQLTQPSSPAPAASGDSEGGEGGEGGEG
jgi:hypothetical protein